MKPLQPKLQYMMDFTIWHCADFGHKIVLKTQLQGRDPVSVASWSWKGLGVPPQIWDEVGAYAAATIQEHILFRYGSADELPIRWAGDPGPF